MDIKDIVKDEVTNVLNEGYVFSDENKNFFFTQYLSSDPAKRTPSVFFHNLETFSTDYDADIIDSDIWLKWHVGYWLNDNGIEGFFIEADGVDGQYTVELRSKQSDEVVQNNVKELKEIPWKFIVEDAVLQKGGSLYVSDITFDFQNNTCTLSF